MGGFFLLSSFNIFISYILVLVDDFFLSFLPLFFGCFGMLLGGSLYIFSP